MSKLLSNYIYNSLYQMVVLLIPLISMPYLSRVLGSEGIGINAFSLSIVQVFILFSILGIPLYGNRLVASVKSKGIEKLSREFWGIFIIQVLSSVAFSLIYVLFVFFSIENNQMIFYIQGLMLFASMIDISWLFFGLEELKKVLVRNMIVRFSSLLCIFIFVNDKNDLAIYVLISVLSNVFGQVLMWTQAFKYVKRSEISKVCISKHLKPVMLLFLPQVIIQLYVIVDKILLGVIANETEVAFYDQALRIVKVTLSIITSASTVMLPRIAAEFSQNNMNKIKLYSNIVVKFVLFMTIPMAVGLAGIAQTFTLWFFGPGYEKVGTLIIILSPIIILIGLSNVFGMQILIPINQQNKVTMAVSMGAIISIIANVILIKYIASIGTAIATVLAEFIVTFILLFRVRDIINPIKYAKGFITYSIASAIMGITIYLLGIYLEISIVFITIVQVGIGFLVYFIILYIVKDEFLFNVINKLFKRKG
ncbi:MULTISPECIES: oligosaccharide flippase family protein [Bacillus cereus group]|uniref:oligosaccharide flippase family protein n=1 Tax=Bacillus cereus group TaxID=86661 RepID=UPI000BEC190C|nr:MULTISPECIES: oligosaccharide flippase family protein [Bacillus cereus group]MCU5392508.1 oligosaccharide flippase family protein [Bacillus toyonensis]PDY54486.1 flippase [Bacillus toyonensis]PEA66952.1 flippase [Bacillus toyonensis]QWH47765.1 flippase [Bacillus toyonensis]HDR7377660.1 oligosaccharide flippase family protein [Bacillus toyonensis]